MKSKTNIVLTLVFTAICCSVATVPVFAEDSVKITNSVHSSSYSGGNHGVDGQNGTDGKDGVDGTPGQDGNYIVTGDEHAWVATTNIIDGSATTDTVEVSSYNGTASIETTIEHTGDTSTQSGDEPVAVSELERTRLMALVTSLQTLLTYYVSTLF